MTEWFKKGKSYYCAVFPGTVLPSSIYCALWQAQLSTGCSRVTRGPDSVALPSECIYRAKYMLAQGDDFNKEQS